MTRGTQRRGVVVRAGAQRANGCRASTPEVRHAEQPPAADRAEQQDMGLPLSGREDATARVGDEGAQNAGNGLAAGPAERSAPERGVGLRARGGTGVPGVVAAAIPVVLVSRGWASWVWAEPTFGSLSDVTSNSQADFLPVDSQATQVQDRLGSSATRTQSPSWSWSRRVRSPGAAGPSARPPRTSRACRTSW
ncbi:hypothetical protein QJS66_03185 [Kocuria rhizophila]|nr:hypothetical protein QJS66_03185 [Kocuria rhizophila]